MPTPSLSVAGRRPPVPGGKRLSEAKGGVLAEKNRTLAGNSNLATAAAFYRLAIQLDEVVSMLALMGFFEGRSDGGRIQTRRTVSSAHARARSCAPSAQR